MKIKKRSRVKNVFNSILNGIEIFGNKLPHPATLFAMLAFLVLIISWLSSFLGLNAAHPVDSSIIEVRNLLSADGIRWIYTNITSNFVNFPPLGLVLVIMIGVGVAEGTGLFRVLIRSLVLNTPKRMITLSLITAGVLSHLASEIGYVILIPLGAIVFHALGRHPIAGLAAAFAGVSGGFGANFFISSVDPVLAGLTQSAARIIDQNITVSPAVNLYFMFFSAILIVIIGTLVTELIVEPRLGKYEGAAEKIPIEEITPVEKKGLKYAGLSALIIGIILALTIIPRNGLFRNPETKDILHSPFFDGMITGIMLIFFIPGLVYGKIVGTIKSDKDLMKHIIKSMGTMATYIVLVFFAAQFVFFFRHSNLGLIMAINGAELIRNTGMGPIPLLTLFVLFCAFLNMFMGSASAKWAMLAPVFVPMLMLLGYHPALTQAAFRIGDSVTNVITPMMSYFALIVSFAQKYSEKYGIGTIISVMIPYCVLFLVFWLILLLAWFVVGVPLGPDGPIHYN